MFCKRCKEKGKVRKQVLIRCKQCGEETYVPLYNNDKCQKCNEAANTCEECGRKIDS
ncbi:hypothetical protein [Cellulosilyticum lentocellum]|uniref:Uncharacterized protein n=1 Tax=Cellulosilyticum lentocellum (strain ATCC 49066 / DSM 5427 / NCIMB 11756 / RHM5) TaxID=642492 RepID=F2JI71_CELLD|nr:hypothetical protein [Cellulosilyticum lentocellum]ADZ83099.1 hypothetical protein Clole_1373 [Cellulosilyticum lentocellum DSM 5427]